MIHFFLINPLFITLFSLLFSFETKSPFIWEEAINFTLTLLFIYFLYALLVWVISYSFSLKPSTDLLWRSGIYSIWLYFCCYLIFIYVDEFIIFEKYQQVTSLELNKIQNSVFWGIFAIFATLGLASIVVKEYFLENSHYLSYSHNVPIIRKIYLLDIMVIFVFPFITMVAIYYLSSDYQKNIYLGRLSYEMRIYQIAHKIFEKNAVQFPQNARNYYWLSRLESLITTEKDYKSSIQYLQKASSLEPKNLHYKLILMHLYTILDNYNEALEIASSVISINFKETQAWKTIGDIKTTLGKIDDAVEAYRNALKYNPSDPIAQNNLAYLLLVLNKDIGWALELAKSNVSTYGTYVYNLDTLAWAYYKNGQISEAYEIMQNITSQAKDLSAEIKFHDLVIKYKLKLIENINKELSDSFLSSDEIKKNILLKTEIENFIKSEGISIDIEKAFHEISNKEKNKDIDFASNESSDKEPQKASETLSDLASKTLSDTIPTKPIDIVSQ